MQRPNIYITVKLLRNDLHYAKEVLSQGAKINCLSVIFDAKSVAFAPNSKS